MPEKDLFAGYSALLTELAVDERELIHDLSLRRLHFGGPQESLIRNVPKAFI